MGSATNLVDHFVLSDVRGDLFLGREVGEYLTRDLMSAKHTVQIVAPGISVEQHQQLAKLAKRGVQITYATEMPTTNQDVISVGSHLINVNLASYSDKITAYNHHHRKSKRAMSGKKVCNFFWIIFLLIEFVVGLALACSLMPKQAAAFISQSGFNLPFSVSSTLDALVQYQSVLFVATLVVAALFLLFLILSRVLKGVSKKAGKIARDHVPFLYRWEYTTNVDFLLFPNSEQRHLAYSTDQNEPFPMVNIRLYIIDGMVAYIGSIDFTTQSLESNLECVMRVIDPYSIERLQNYVRTLMSINHHSVINSATFAEYYINNFQMALYAYPEGVNPAPGLWTIYNKTLDVKQSIKQDYEEGFAQGLTASQSLPVTSEISEFLQNTATA